MTILLVCWQKNTSHLTKNISDKMSAKAGSTLDTRSEAESEETEADEELNFVLREVPHTETQTTCKLCFRPAQVT